MDHLKYEQEELKRTGTEIVRILTIPFTYNYRKVASKVSLRGQNFPPGNYMPTLGKLKNCSAYPLTFFTVIIILLYSTLVISKH